MSTSQLFETSHLADGTAWGNDTTKPLIALVDAPLTRQLVPDSDGLVHVKGWSASHSNTRHTIEVQHLGRHLHAAPMSPRPDVIAHLKSDRPGEFDNGAAWNISLFLHLPQGEVTRTYRIIVSDGEYLCDLGHFTLTRGTTRDATDPAFERVEYKKVWNSVATDMANAMTAVAGYHDEETYDLTAKLTVDHLESTVGVRPDDVILEIGAGVGRVGKILAPKCRKWIATDVSENMLRYARDRNAEHTNIDYVALSGWDLEPIPSESVDVVYCTVVFMHLDEWERFNYVREAHRVLRPGGRIYVDNFNLLSEPGWQLFLGVIEHHHPLNRPPNVSRSSTPAELEMFLTKAGFLEVRSSGAPEVMFCHAWGKKGDRP